MMNILVTGVSGFIGSCLINVLKEKYGGKANIVLLTSQKIKDFTCITHRNYSYVVDDFIREGINSIDVVIHLGWFVAKTIEEQNDILKNYIPLLNTKHLLENLPSIPKKIVFCSSVDVYGLHDGECQYSPSIELINEETMVNPKRPYGFNKYCGELLIRDFCRNHGIICHVLRLGPIYGEGDARGSFMLGAMLRQVALGKNLNMYADPRMKRNLLYVEDVCYFIANSIELNEDVGPINVVSDANPSMSQIVELIMSMDSKKIIKCNKHTGPYTGRDLAFSSNKRKKYLGNENYNLETGIEKTYLWVKSNVSGGE